MSNVNSTILAVTSAGTFLVLLLGIMARFIVSSIDRRIGSKIDVSAQARAAEHEDLTARVSVVETAVAELRREITSSPRHPRRTP